MNKIPERVDLDAVLETAKSNAVYYLIIFLVLQGLRVSEISSLKRKNFDFRNKVLVYESATLTQKRVPLPENIINTLQNYFSSRRDKYPNAFINSKGPLTPDHVSVIIHNVSFKANPSKRLSAKNIRERIALDKIHNGITYSQVAHDLGLRPRIDWLIKMYNEYAPDNISFQKSLGLKTPYKKGAH
ncbi:tyrosine-type recombinase/integrase [Desulfosporosinus sp. SYSU MS00001]|uniref:tyrosine-type recombinase/integrase n=1 Tax=Desulfosporosinus sp. SYSU MS00001 TaxID=3416284 RepID=UPI003CF25A38